MTKHLSEFYVRKAYSASQEICARLSALGDKADQDGVDAFGFHDEAGKLKILVVDRLKRALKEIRKND